MKTNEEKLTLDIVYNGDKLTLDEEQARNLAQKGMNYDRLYEKYEETAKKLGEAAAYREKIDSLAQAAGTTPESIIGLLDKNIKDFQISNYAESEKIPPEYAEKMMSLTREIEALKREKEELLPIKKREEDIAAFNKEYPDVDVRGIDEDILSLWESSDKPLADVYNSVMLKKLLNKQQAEIANEQNKKASSGSVKDAAAGEKIYSEDEIRNMSDDEIKRNFKALVRQLSKKGDE